MSYLLIAESEDARLIGITAYKRKGEKFAKGVKRTSSKS